MQNVSKYSVRIISWMLVTAGLFIAAPAFAATIELSPASVAVSAGDTLTLTIYANSDQSINAVTASLSFPSDILSVVSLNKTSSAFTLWVQEPSYSNSDGTINLSGIVPDPGVSGRSRVLIIQMRAKKEGTATIRFASAALLANDGQGTNVLTGSISSTVTISASVKPTTPTQTTKPVQTAPQETPTEPEPSTASPTAFMLTAPTIVRYSKMLHELDPVVISGTSAYPGTNVTVHLSKNGVETIGNTLADAQGNFIFVQEDGLSAGNYVAYADINQDGNKSAISNIVGIQVVTGDSATVVGFSVPASWLLWIIAILTLMLVAVSAQFYRRVRRLRHTMDRNLHDVEASLHYATRQGKHQAHSAKVKGVVEKMKDRIESTISQLHEEI